MKKNIVKDVLRIILLIALFVILLNNSIIYANDSFDPIENPLSFKPGILTSQSDLKEKAEVILGIVNFVGVISSVVALIIIGIKYMYGTIEEKAEYKQELFPYIIGAIFIFSATTIPNIIYKLTANLR